MLRSSVVISVILFLSGQTALIYAQFAEFSQPYEVDAGHSLDFVYHSHEEMTDFLRYVRLPLRSTDLIKYLSIACVDKQLFNTQT